MAVKALAKAVRISPRKVAVVAALVRGRTVAEALTILQHTPRQSAVAVAKVVKSARANAEHNHNYRPDTLRIVEITVMPGPRFKRIMPVARGSANPYQLKTSHIKVLVDGDLREVKKPKTSEEVKKPVEAKLSSKAAKEAK